MAALRHRAWALIRPDDEDGAAARIFDTAVVGMILISAALVVLDTFALPANAMTALDVVEIVTDILFTAEYILRVWTAPDKYPGTKPLAARVRFVLSFVGLIDLVAILPFYLPFILPGVPHHVILMLQPLRILRLLKFHRYVKAFSTVGEVVRRKASLLLSASFIILILLFLSAVLMYNVEDVAQPGVFKNVFDGLWWAIATLTTVGYGDIYPVTMLGKLFTAIISLCGLSLLAIPTCILSSGFVELTQEKRSAGKDKLRQSDGALFIADTELRRELEKYLALAATREIYVTRDGSVTARLSAAPERTDARHGD
jgi:voltage-gated potassium channel